MANTNSERMYNDPAGGVPSDIGPQMNDFYYQKKALIEMKKEQYFSQMADVTSMPKHFGKTIKKYHYLPLLDDANINDQGIDAAGNIANGTDGTYTATVKAAPNQAAFNIAADHLDARYFTAENAVAATATTAAEAAASAYFATIGLTDTATAVAAGWIVTGANGNVAAIPPVPNTGNLYGSSKDVATIVGKLPLLSEQGGRKNRVGFKRVEIEGSIEKFGFFDEYTKESVDFDSDSELMMHVNREMLNGANEITEDAIQIDLLNGAGVIRYGGDATSKATITGENGATPSLITYEDLMRLSIDLDNNRCPKNTKVITGSRMVDTRVVDAARYMYIGSELIPMIKRMTDLFGNQAFIPVAQYGAAGTIATGEIGTVDQFRIIVVPEMMSWAGEGATESTNDGYRATGGKYDVYPLLVVGDASFTTIGFQTDGKTVKFKIKHVKPESDISYSSADPYGELGFMSIKWYYGLLILRPERIALCLSVAEL